MILLSFLLILCSCSQKDNYPVAKNGVLDLRGWNFVKDGQVPLNGEWELYWNKLYTPENFDSSKCKKDCFIEVPYPWDEVKINGKNLPETGFATYRLIVLTNRVNKNLIIDRNTSGAALTFKIYVNQQLAYFHGNPESRKSNKTLYYGKNYRILNATGKLEILIPVSNFHSVYKGMIDELYLGDHDSIIDENNKISEIILVLYGFILMFLIYHILLFFLNSKNYSSLFLSLMGISILLQLYLTSWWEISSYNLFYFLLNLFFLFIIFSSFAYIYSLFPKQMSRKIIIRLFILCILYTIIAIINILSSIIPEKQNYFLIFILSNTNNFIFIILLIQLIQVVIKAVKNKENDAKLFLLALCIIVFCYIGETYFFPQLWLINTGLFLFILIQAYILSARYTKSLRQNIILNKELTSINKNLEKIVEARTAEVVQQKDELIEKNTTLNQLNEEISKQRDEISFQHEQISIQKKNIIDSINYAKRIQSAVLPEKKLISDFFSEHFIFFQPRDIVSGDFYFVKQIGSYIIIAAADSTGHGVPGAFLSMLGITLLNEIVRNSSSMNSSLILNKLRVHIKNALQQTGKTGEQQESIDIAFCAINLDNLMMSFAGANNPCLIFRKPENISCSTSDTPEISKIQSVSEFELITLDADHMPVGIYTIEKPFTEKSFQLKKNDIFYLFTDGFSSQFGGDKYEKYKARRMKEFLHSICYKNMNEQEQLLEKEYNQWKGNNEQTDDVLIVGVKI